MAPRGGSAPRGAQVVDPAGAGDRWLPMGVGGRTGWSRDVRDAAAEKGGQFAHPRPLSLLQYLMGEGRAVSNRRYSEKGFLNFLVINRRYN